MKYIFIFFIKKISNTWIGNYILFFMSKENNLNLHITNGTGFQQKIATILKLIIWKISRFNKSKKRIMRELHLRDIHNYKMILDVNEFTQCGYFLGFYDSKLIKLIRLGGDIFVDVGANVGFYSLNAANYYANVLSFEPVSETYSNLNENVSLNSFNNIDLFKVGLSDSKAIAEIHLNPLNSGGASLKKFSENVQNQFQDYKWEKETIELTTIDEVMKKISPNKKILMKIDVEGHELSVLKGGLKTINLFRPLIYAEIMRDEEKFKSIKKILPSDYASVSLQEMTILNDSISISNDVLFVPFEKLVDISLVFDIKI